MKDAKDLEAVHPGAALYRGMSDYTAHAVRADAERAAKQGLTVDLGCPYPYFTEEGKLWRKVHAELSKGQS